MQQPNEVLARAALLDHLMRLRETRRRFAPAVIGEARSEMGLVGMASELVSANSLKIIDSTPIEMALRDLALKLFDREIAIDETELRRLDVDPAGEWGESRRAR